MSMDDYYASLLREDGSDNQSLNSATEPTLISMIVSRKAESYSKGSSSWNNNQSCRLAVTARVPRKRMDALDKVKYTLQYFSFLDDRRRFTNLDALLTRLAPVGVVHLSCTESAETSQNASSIKQNRRAKEVSNLLSKIQSLLNSRNDILHQHEHSPDANASQITNLIPTLPRHISNPNNAALQQYLDTALLPMLGGESHKSHLLYKGDQTLMNDALIKQSISLLLHTENLSQHNNGTDGDDFDDDNVIYEIVHGDLSSHLTLDRTAAECINLLPPRHSGISTVDIGGSQSNNSLFGVLNQCVTKMGTRTLELWLRQPLVDLEQILYRQTAVRTLVEENLGRDRLRDEGLHAMKGLDLDALCGKLSNSLGAVEGTVVGGTAVALENLYKLYLFADGMLPKLIECLGDFDGNDDKSESPNDKNGALEVATEGLNRVMNELVRSVQLVEAVLDLDVAPREFLVKASFNEELQDIRQELDAVNVELDQIHSEMNELWANVSGQSVGQVRLEVGDSSANGSKHSSCAWQFRLPDTNASKILQSSDFGTEVTVHRLLKNGVYFSTKQLRQLGTKKHDLLAEYEKNQRDIVKNAMTVAITYIPVLERASSIVAELDVLASFAHVAVFNPHGYCRPEMTDAEEDGLGIELKEARHPCVELQENVDFIPNDISLIYGSSSFLIVTGPNMGGKSTYIRSLGAIITLAQIGSYVPCASAKINIVHHILARVGAGDVQDRGISTFMAEMLEASSILRTATKRSLIIIDELGRGTSTFDGFGLATAISEYIVQRIGCMTVFATHFHELTALEDQEKAVKNCHVTADRGADGSNGLTFLYEVRPGPCLESFGIQVAEMANVPPTVINDAKRKAKLLENFDYQKKAKTQTNEDNNKYNERMSSEDREAMDFLNKFKSLPFKTFRTAVEKREALAQILQ